jgi:hypothetical protein
MAVGGCNVITLGLPGSHPPDLYLYHDRDLAPDEDWEFVAAARNLVPRLVAELKARRADG